MKDSDGPFIVSVEVRYSHTANGVHEYLSAVNWDPYLKGGDQGILTSLDAREAFQFSALSAAETIAAFVGGKVIPYTNGGGNG